MKRILIPFLAALFVAQLLPAQATKDFLLWKGIILQKSFLDGKLQASLNEEVRLRNNLSEVGNSYTDISAHYSVLKRLSLGLGYRYAIRPDINTHRVYSDLSWQPKLKGRFKLSLRTRFQHDRSPVDQDFHLRPRLNLFYNIKDSKLTPFVGAEPFFKFAGSFSGVDAFRLYAGVRYPVRKKVELRVGYILDQELMDPTPDQNHVLSVRLTIDLDKSDDKELDSEKGW